MSDHVSCWRGKPIEDLSREEMIEVINFLANQVRELNSPENLEARALGFVAMLKRGRA